MTMTEEAVDQRAEGRAPKRLGVHECELFLLHEARLLDKGQFDDWLALFTPDARYWVPSEPDQASPIDTVSLIYDDRQLLETRVRRLASPRIYSQEPRSRTSRNRDQCQHRGGRGRRIHAGAVQIYADRIPPQRAASVRRHLVPSTDGRRRRGQDRVETRGPGKL